MVMVFAIMIFPFPLADGSKHGWSNADFIFMVVAYPLVVLLLWWVFVKVHPVSFDDNFIYWGKSIKEQKVRYDRIINFSIYHFRSGHLCKVKYLKEDDNVGVIRFYLILPWVDDPEPLLAEIESLGRVNDPCFRIDKYRDGFGFNQE